MVKNSGRHPENVGSIPTNCSRLLIYRLYVMQHIKQRFRTDCFPTCIAMIAGITHEKAIKIVHPRRKRGSRYGTNLITGCKALKKLKIRHNWFMPWGEKVKLKDIKNPAIICVKFPEHTTYSHVVVWDPNNNKILDPGMDKPYCRAKYEKNIKWYLEIL